MEFRVLGPLEVHHRGRPVAVRGRRQRALLAKLVLELGTAVQDERLLDDLWSGSPPASGSAALRVRVSQLRKALAAAEPGGDAGAVIVTRGSGYALEADRPSVLAGAAARDAGRLPARPEPHRGSRLRPPLLRLGVPGRARARVQARAHP